MTTTNRPNAARPQPSRHQNSQHMRTNDPMANPPEEHLVIDLPAFLDQGAAVCAQPGLPVGLWTSDDAAEQLAAAVYCRACPLKAVCLEYALTNSEPAGVWGGLSSRERSRLRKPARPWVDPAARVRHPCGGEPAFKAHRLYGEQCVECEAVHEELVRTGRLARLVVIHAAGGSPTGAALHRRLGEAVCVLCRLSVARQSAVRRAARETPAQGAAAAA